MLVQMKKLIGAIASHAKYKRLKLAEYRNCCRCFASASDLNKQKGVDVSEFPVENIRNFSIIAHVDHGKSTLADRLLELSGTISVSDSNKQVLDKLQVERERGITVKAQTATLFYEFKGTKYMLNLIDTPGHVDFNYEVSRSLSACQGVILLIDANQGIQAQTVANFYLAFEAELVIIPVMNKIDLKVARPEEVQQQIQTMFDFKPEEIHKISAKKGTGVEELIQAVIEKLPPPTGDIKKPAKALIFDSWFDKFRGAGCNLAVLDGMFKKGDRVRLVHTGKTHEIQDLGIMFPEEYSTNILYAGQVGFMYAQLKTTDDAQVGDTVHLEKSPVDPLPGFKPAVPMVFAGFFPSDQSEFGLLKNAIQKLTLNDSSVEVNADSSAALGQGWRLGFLGLLHMDVFMQRLEQEYNASVIVTSPNVPYKIVFEEHHAHKSGKKEDTILNPCHLPPVEAIKEYHEPMVMSTIISPDDYLSGVNSLIMDRRGEQLEQTYIDNKRVMFKVVFPLNEIVLDFFDELKSMTSGYASFDYEDYGYRQSNLVRIDIALNGKLVDELTQIAHVTKARSFCRHLVNKLKECIPPQLFIIAIQAKVGNKVVAREDIKALRKDVLAKCYGGDITRKTKLLRQQAEGKKKMRLIGNVSVPKDAFIKIMKR